MPQLSIVGYTPLPDDTKKPPGPITVRSREEVLGQLDRGLNAPAAQPASTGLTIAGYEPPRATDEERRTVLGFLGNTVGSTGRLLGGLVNVPEQVKGVTALFSGMAEKSGFKALPGQPDGNAVDSLIAHYKDRYGSFEGFQKAMYEDPAGVMFDVATVLEPAAGGLKLAGLPRAAAVTTRVARNINPVALTLRGGAAALPHVAPVIRAAPTAIEGGAKGAYKAAVAPRTAGEAALGYVVGQVAGPQAGAAVSTTLTGARVARGAYRGAREALKARAEAAAEALAAENAAAAEAARPGPIPVTPEPPPPTAAPVVPSDPIVSPPPAAAARPTPAPEPAPAAPTPPTATMSPAARLRQEMGLQPGEFEPPTTFEPPGVATAARKAQIDRMARHMRESGITAAQADLLDPPALADLAKLAGAEGSLGKVAKEVKLRMQEFETEASETAKYQAAWDKLSKGERRAFFDDENAPPPAAPPAEPAVTTPAEANVELGKRYPAPEPVETPALPSASQKRVKALAEWLAEEPIGTDLVEKLETDARARLLLGEQSRRLGHRSIGPGEIPQIIEEVKRLRSEGVKPAALQPTPIAKAQADFDAAKAAAPEAKPAPDVVAEPAHRLPIDEKGRAILDLESPVAVAMRKIDADAQRLIEYSEKLRPRGGEVAVGKEGVHEGFTGWSIRTLLREVGRGKLIEEAAKIATEELVAANKLQNTRNRDYVTHRWERHGVEKIEYAAKQLKQAFAEGQKPRTTIEPETPAKPARKTKRKANR